MLRWINNKPLAHGGRDKHGTGVSLHSHSSTMRQLLSTLCLLLVPALSAQTIFDDFENYSVGSFLAQSNPSVWNTWNFLPGTPQDAPIADQFASSGSKSARFTQTAANGGATDIVLYLNKSTGIWELDFDLYVPSGSSAYFNIQRGPGLGALEVFFYDGGHVNLNAAHITFAGGWYVQDAWNDVTITVNLDTDFATLRVNGATIGSWPYNVDFNGNTVFNPVLGFAEFYPQATNSVWANYYLDNVSFGPPSITTSLREVQANAGIAVWPNPFADVLNFKAEELPIGAIATFIDQQGKRVLEKAIDQNGALAASELTPGLYTAIIRSDTGRWTARIRVAKVE